MCTGRRTGGARRSSSFAHVDAFQAHPCRAPSPGNPIPGREAVNRRRHLLPGHGAGVLRLVLAALPPFRRPVLRCAAFDTAHRRPTTARILLLTKGRNINRLPFRRPGVAAVRGSPRARHRTPQRVRDTAICWWLRTASLWAQCGCPESLLHPSGFKGFT